MQTQGVSLWVETLKKSTGFIRLFNDKGKVYLPYFPKFDRDKSNKYWAFILESDGNTKTFIDAVKTGKFASKGTRDDETGINRTIDKLEYFKIDINRYKEIDEITDLTDDPNKDIIPDEIRSRLQSIIDEVLPFLQKHLDKKRSRKPKEKPVGADRITVNTNKHITLEWITETLEDFFPTWNDNQKKRYLENLNDYLDRIKKEKWNDLKGDLVQNFPHISKNIQNYGWHKYRKVQIWDKDMPKEEEEIKARRKEGLKELGFTERVRFGKTILETDYLEGNELKRIKYDAQDIIGKIPSDKKMPIFQLWGSIEAHQDVEPQYVKRQKEKAKIREAKKDWKGDRTERTPYIDPMKDPKTQTKRPEIEPGFVSTTEWKVKSSFTAEDAEKYLKTIAETTTRGLFRDIGIGSVKDVWVPEKLAKVKETSNFLHASIYSLLSKKYEKDVLDGTMAIEFLRDLQDMRFSSEETRLNYTAEHKVWANRYNKDSPYYVELDISEPAEFKDYKEEIKEKLRSGEDEGGKQYRRDKKRNIDFNERLGKQSITESENEFLTLMLKDTIREKALDRFPDNEEDYTENQNKINEILKKIVTRKEPLSKKNIKYHLDVPYFYIENEEDFKNIKKLIQLIANEEDSEDRFTFKGRHNKIIEDNREDMEKKQKQLSEVQGVIEVDFNEGAFNTESQKNLAKVVYRILVAGEDLDKRIKGKFLKQNIDSLDNLYNVIIALQDEYNVDTANDIKEIVETIKPTEDLKLMSDSPEYKDEIIKLSDTIEDILPKLRMAITEDVQKRLEWLLSKSKFIQTKIERKYQKNPFNILKNKGIFVGR